MLQAEDCSLGILYCIGETKEDRESERNEEVLSEQLTALQGKARVEADDDILDSSPEGDAAIDAVTIELFSADGLIEAQEQQTLQQIMDGKGNAAFRAIEEQVLTDMPIFPSVISTGGSCMVQLSPSERGSSLAMSIAMRLLVFHSLPVLAPSIEIPPFETRVPKEGFVE